LRHGPRKQTGQTIRQEDLLRAFEERFYLSAEISAALEGIASNLESTGAKLQAQLPGETILRTLNPAAALARASDAVTRGNKKVFEEIGREFARFLDVFHDDDHFDHDKTVRFCAALRLGEPPDGQRLLTEAFTRYCQARFQTGKEKAELMLLANVCGFHEQIRLQPEIAEALNASLGDSSELRRHLLTLLLPDFSIRARARVLRNHHSYLDGVFGGLIREVNRLIRQVITDHLMTLHLSSKNFFSVIPKNHGRKNPIFNLRVELRQFDVGNYWSSYRYACHFHVIHRDCFAAPLLLYIMSFWRANVRSHYRKFFHLSETHNDGWEHAYDSGRFKYTSFFCDRIDPGFSRGQDRKKEIFYSEKRSDGQFHCRSIL